MKRSLMILVVVALASAIPVSTAGAVPLTFTWAPMMKATAPVPHVQFTVNVSTACDIYTTVYRNDRLVRALPKVTARSRATVRTTWDFRNYAGKVISPGVYKVRVMAVRSSGRTISYRDIRVPDPVPAVTRWIGYYPQGNLSSTTALDSIESDTARKAKVVQLYVADSESFPTNRVKTITDRGAIPLITWEFWSVKTGGAAAIANGSKDAYIRSFAAAAKATGKEIWIRPLHEMNSNWYPWAGATNGNTAADVVSAWRRINSVVDGAGATNVKLVWCPNNESVPNTSANAIEQYWPGDAYVDLLAIDGYNFGTSASWSSWRSFSKVMEPCYAKVTSLSSKPLFLAEVGCVEQGGDKGAWISDMFSRINSPYPRIRGVVWFNVNDTGANQDFRVESSTSALTAFKNRCGSY
jgi:hypothetical protein